jgi:hypothetical protein
MPKIANSSKLILILSTFILIGLLVSSHQTRSFFHSKTKIELKNDSLSLLFDPKIAEQKNDEVPNFFELMAQPEQPKVAAETIETEKPKIKIKAEVVEKDTIPLLEISKLTLDNDIPARAVTKAVFKDAAVL